MPERPFFTRELFRFFLDLEMNNNREWFHANQSRYEEHVKAPALRFITEFGSHLYPDMGIPKESKSSASSFSFPTKGEAQSEPEKPE